MTAPILCMWCKAEWTLDCVCCVESFEAMIRIREREEEDMGRLRDIERMDDEAFEGWWESHSMEEKLSELAYMGQVMERESYTSFIIDDMTPGSVIEELYKDKDEEE